MDCRPHGGGLLRQEHCLARFYGSNIISPTATLYFSQARRHSVGLSVALTTVGES